MAIKLPHSVYNWTSVIGGVIAIISFFIFIFLFTISYFFNQGSSYLGLFIYIVIPIFLVVGLILIPIGMLIKIRTDKRIMEGREPKMPFIDLNNSRHKNAFIIFAVFTSILLFFTAIGSYEAFHYSESVEFCGTLCHTVMKPEFVAYQNSAHARVPCVECHVGPGADWFVRSKLSGLYQVYAVTFNKYPKPIPTPITNLRPARETCERCHWPEKFYARQLKIEKHFLADKNNTEWDISLEIKTGAIYSALGLQEGIHWHINPDIQIDYIASTDDREVIPWVQYTNLKTKKVIVYQNTEEPIDPALIINSKIRTMDCMDCHNRPSHAYKSPAYYVDNALTAGRLPKDLPELKYIAMEVLKVPYPSTDSTMYYIDNKIKEFYKDKYPDIYKDQYKRINNAVSVIQAEFQKNCFPEMKVSYDVYPDHISHMESDGCFRCHDGLHASDDGEVISKDCNLCHMIVSQGTPGETEYMQKNIPLVFKHPIDIGELWKEIKCTECHRTLYP